jgi:DNA-binding transcriptional MerR regulator
MAHDLLTIGEFSRLVGVTPSALRYYDDVGLLVPAEVSPGTGYRRYARKQRRRAVIIRMLRDAGLSLADIRQVVDRPSHDARQIVAAHLKRNAVQATQAATALRRVMQVLAPGEFHARATVAGPELASGIRQVLHAIDGSDVALAQVLVEIAVDEVRLVTTDRYRLAVRTLRSHDFEGDAAQAGVAAADVRQLARPLLLVDTVELRIGAAGLTCIIDGEHHVLTGQQAAFPDFRAMLDHLTPGEVKLVADRGALLGFLRSAEAASTVLVQGAGGHASLITGAHAVRFGTWIGPCLRAAFAVSHLEEALAISVGPDVIIELADGPRPAVIRSADHGSLTTLIMPHRTPGVPATDPKDQEHGPEQPDRPALRAGYGGRAGGPAG